LVGFRLAAAAGVLDFFAMYLTYCGYDFVFKIDKFNLCLQRFLGAGHDAFATAFATVRIHHYVEFA
jgi:hypothetical protein